MYQCKNRCNLKHATFSMSGLLIGLVTILTCESLLLAPLFLTLLPVLTPVSCLVKLTKLTLSAFFGAMIKY